MTEEVVRSGGGMALARGGGGREEPGESPAGLLEGAELFPAPDGSGYLSAAGARRREIWPLQSREAHRWLSLRLFERDGRPPGASAIQAVVNLLEALAARDGREHPVFTRKAEQEGVVYLDLADAAGRAVAIGAGGWRVLGEAPVRFRRPAGMRPLPPPHRGGTLDELRPFLHTAGEDDLRLLVTWLLAALGPTGPCPLLALSGEPGAGKGTTARVLRRLADPGEAELRHDLRGPRDLALAAQNSLIVGVGPLPAMPRWLPEALCCLATGGSFATRRQFAREEEVTFAALRPALLTSAVELALAPELLQRALRVSLPVIPEDQLRAEAEMWAAFEAARPRILGALLDVVAAGLGRLPGLPPARLPRMADFARWGCAVEADLGWAPGGFLAAYAANRGEAAGAALEPSALAGAIRELVAAAGEWTGSCKELLPLLTARAVVSAQGRRGWPATPEALSQALRGLASALRAAGVAVTFLPRTRAARPVRLEACAAAGVSRPGDGAVTVAA